MRRSRLYDDETNHAYHRRENDMMNVKFKNLEKSEMAREAVHDRVDALIKGLKFIMYS